MSVHGWVLLLDGNQTSHQALEDLVELAQAIIKSNYGRT